MTLDGDGQSRVGAMRGVVRAMTPLVVMAMATTLLAGCGDDAEGQSPTTQSCPKPVPEPGKKVKPKTIYLDVVNASSKGGLAGKTAVQFEWRGFNVLDTRNQDVTDGRPTPKTAEIRYGAAGRDIALTVATQLANPELVKDDRNTPTVDVVIGENFKMNPVPPPPAKEVSVNVYNTTFRAGLSGEVSKKLKARGFTIKANGNDPSKSFLPDDTVLIRHGERGEPYARRVALQFKGARMVQDGRESTEVDVAIGNKYKSLVPEASATPPPTKKPKPQPGC